MGVAAKVLADQLQRYGHGDALWNPTAASDEEVQLGDVGFIDEEGSFMRFFNVTVDANDSLNKDGVPEGFKPVALDKRLYKFLPQCHIPGPLTSSSVRHTSSKGHAGANAANLGGAHLTYQFACNSESGAWLVLKDFSEKHYLLDNCQLKRYMLQNHDAWFNFASGESLGIDCKPYDIILVKGFVKTSAWAVAAYKSGVRSTQAMSLTGTVGGVGDAGFEFRVESSEGYMFDTRYGPEGRDSPASLLASPPQASISFGKGKKREELQDLELTRTTSHTSTTGFPRDQSVFLSYYKIKHKFWRKKVIAHAGPDELPRGPDEEQSMAVLSSDALVEEVPSRQQQHLPIDDLLDYIFENSDAEIAIASHDDISDLFQNQFVPDDLAAWLQQNHPAIAVDDDKLGYLAIRDSIVRNRIESLQNAVAQQDLVEEEEQNKCDAIVEAQNAEEEEERQKQRALAAASRQAEQPVDGALQDPPEAQHEPSSSEVPQQEAVTVTGDATQTGEEASTNHTPAPSVAAAQPPPQTLHDCRSNRRSDTQGRQYGSSVQSDGKVYLGGRDENKFMKCPHMVLVDHATDGCGITSIAVSASTQRIASTCEDSVVRVWDLATGARLMPLIAHTEMTQTVAFSPDGSKLVSGGADHKAILWNLNNHQPIKHLEGHTSDVWTCDYSPNGKYIATGSTDCMVKIWDGMDGNHIRTLQEHAVAVMVVEFSPDSERLVSCADSVGCIWSTDDGSLLARITGHTNLIWSAKFSADCTRIVTASEDYTARVWNVEDGQELVTLAEHSGPIWSATFSPDDNDVASASYDGQVVVCDSYTGEKRHRLEDDHPAIVNSVAYSKDGQFIVAGCADGALKLWNAKDGEFVAEFMGHDDKVKDAVFSPDDCHIISCSDDSTLRIWNVVDVLRV